MRDCLLALKKVNHTVLDSELYGVKAGLSLRG